MTLTSINPFRNKPHKKGAFGASLIVCVIRRMKMFFLACCALLLSYSGLLAQPGNLIWSRNFGGSNDEPVGLGTGIGGAPAVAAQSDAAGNIYVATFSESSDGDVQNPLGSEDIWVLKISPDGDTLWTRNFGGESFERCYALLLLSDGNLLVAGKTASNGGNLGAALGSEDAFLLKLNPDGGIVWARRYGGTQLETFFGIAEMPNGDLLACGITGSIDGDIQNNTWVGANKAWVMRIQPNGTPIWSRITNGLVNNDDWEESFWHTTYNPDNQRIYCLGASYNFNDINSDELFLCELNDAGLVQNRYTYGGNGGDTPAGLKLLADGSLLLFGTIRGGGQDVSNYMGGNADNWLLRVNNSGSIIWEKTFGGTGLDYAYGLGSDPAGNTVLIGSTRSIDNTSGSGAQGLFDGWLAAVNTNGDTLYVRRYGSTQNDHLHALVPAPGGDFYLIGRSQGSGGDVAGNSGETDLWIMRREGEDVTGVSGINKLMSLYPNPALAGQLLQFGTPQKFAELIAPDGRLVLRCTDCSAIEIPATLSTGVYLIRSNTGQSRIVVQ